MAEIKKKKTLEDFFAQPPKVRQEYVTAPEKEAEVVEHFEDERQVNEALGKQTVVTKKGRDAVVESGPLEVSGIVPKNNTPKPMAPAAEEELPEIQTPSVRESIRGDMPQRQVAAEAPTPAPKKEDSSFPWDRALIGATPLLVGLLTGNKMEGVQVAGNHLVKDEGDLYKRERDLNAKIAELKQKKEEGVGGSRRFTAQTIALNDGTNVKATFDTFTGRYMDPSGQEIPSNFIRAGYAVNPEEDDRRLLNRLSTKKDFAEFVGTGAYTSPTTGERVYLRNGVEVPVMGQHTGTLTVKQQQEAEKLRAEFKGNPIVKRTLPVLSGANQIMQLLNSGKAVSQAAAKTILARMAGEVGNLNQMEQEIYTRSPSINSRIKGWLNLQATDEALQPHEVEDLKMIAGFYASAAKEMMGGAIAETQAIGREDYNLPSATVERLTSPIAEPLMDQARRGAVSARGPEIKHKGRTLTPPNPKLKMAVEINGEVKWTDEPWHKVKAAYPKAKRLN